MSTVTAVIPTFNRAQFIERAICSVLSQSYKPDEIIIVDDGSDDETAKIVSEIKTSSKENIQYLFQKNGGPSSARNAGIEMATSDYIAFLDSDDLWQKRKLETQLAAFKKCPRYRISHTGEKWYRRGVHLNRKKKHLQKSGDIFLQCLSLCAVGMSTVMVKKELFAEYGLFDVQLPCCEDYDFWLRITGHEPILLIDQTLTVKHGGREDQVSARFRLGMDVFRIQAMEKLVATGVGHLQNNEKISLFKELVGKCRIYAKGCEKHGKVAEAARYFQKIDQYKEEIKG